MFSYVDAAVRKKLLDDGKLICLDKNGRAVKPHNGGQPYIALLGPVPLPREICGSKQTLFWYPFMRRTDIEHMLQAAGKVNGSGAEELRQLLQDTMAVNSLLTTANFVDHPKPLVRIHSCCMTGDVFGSLRCECGPQLDQAFECICAAGGGAVVYMSGHEGRGIGLWAKAVAYLLQDDGQNTYEANRSLGLPEDARDFTDAAVVLRYLLDGQPIRLLSNNPLKRKQLENAGQPVSEMVCHVTGINAHNENYMRTKRIKGHLLPEMWDSRTEG